MALRGMGAEPRETCDPTTTSGDVGSAQWRRKVRVRHRSKLLAPMPAPDFAGSAAGAIAWLDLGGVNFDTRTTKVTGDCEGAFPNDTLLTHLTSRRRRVRATAEHKRGITAPTVIRAIRIQQVRPPGAVSHFESESGERGRYIGPP